MAGLDEKRILSKLLGIYDLPSLPEVIVRILAIIEDEGSSASDLTKLLESDHAISARVLRLANSAYYGLGQRVDSIRRAVVVLGFEAVRHLALATSVFDTLTKRTQFALDPEDFWMHSLGAAKAAQLICSKHARVESPEGCFTGALLHDVGKYLLAIVLPDEYRAVVAEAAETKCMLYEIEQQRLETNHARVGGWLLDKWQFPPVIVDTVAYCQNLRNYSGPHGREVAVVNLANALSRGANFGSAGDYGPCRPCKDTVDHLSLPVDFVKETSETLEGVRRETRQFLSLMAQT